MVIMLQVYKTTRYVGWKMFVYSAGEPLFVTLCKDSKAARLHYTQASFNQ